MLNLNFIIRIVPIAICTLSIVSTSGIGSTLHVPIQYDRIQEAIDASQDGDTVVVANGIYTGDGNKDINYSGKAIVVMSENGPHNCIIDCEYDGRGFWFYTNEDTNSVLEGIKIINGNAYNNYGGGIKIAYSSPLIKDCIVTNCQSRVGGGISCGTSAAVIRNCVISDNIADVDGGGLDIGGQPGPILTRCRIQNNTSIWNGAGIDYGNQCHGTIEYCVITGNTSNWGEGGGLNIFNGCYPDILFCTISENYAISGDGIYCSYSTPSLISCIIWDDGIVDNQMGGLSAIYSNIMGGWLGLGNLNEDPLFVMTEQRDYRLHWGSPCVDSGDPDPQYNDPDATRADMGYLYYGQSMAQRVLLTSYHAPIEIPASGGNFDFTIWLTNIDPSQPPIQIWTDVTLPSGSHFGPLIGPFPAQVDSGITVDRMRTQTVPSGASGGLYHYNIYAVVDADTSTDSFIFTKLGSDLSDRSSGWSNTGESFEEWQLDDQQEIHVDYTLLKNYPNPFNPSTTISFQLPVASHVELRVYDINGRVCMSGSGTTPTTGFFSPGSHYFTFDGAGLASGVYIYRLEAGDFSGQGKMLLVK